MKIIHLVESQDLFELDATGMTPDQYKAIKDANKKRGQEIAQKIAAAKNQATTATQPQTAPADTATQPQTAPADTAPQPDTTQAQDTQQTTQAQVDPEQQVGQDPQTSTGPTGDPTLDAPLPGQPKQGRGFVKGLANVVGQTAKGIGAVAGGVAGAGRALKKGYNAGANAVGGPGYSSQAGNQAPATGAARYTGGGSGAAGGADLQSINQRLSKVEKLVGAAEGKNNTAKPVVEFYSKFLGQII
jgi:hypothetical protein